MTTVIRNGMVYDGNDAPPRSVDVLVGDDGRIVSMAPLVDAPQDATVIDAAGCWVTPGFVDLHTHYDAEVEMAPGLTESLRHVSPQR